MNNSMEIVSKSNALATYICLHMDSELNKYIENKSGYLIKLSGEKLNFKGTLFVSYLNIANMFDRMDISEKYNYYKILAYGYIKTENGAVYSSKIELIEELTEKDIRDLLSYYRDEVGNLPYIEDNNFLYSDDSSILQNTKNIKGSKAIINSRYINDSYLIRNSSFVQKSDNISASMYINDSLNVADSFLVSYSENILGSYIIADSKNIYNCYNIINCSNITNSALIFNSDHIDNSIGICTTDFQINSIFCNLGNINKDKYYVFNIGVSKAEFNVIYDKIIDILENIRKSYLLGSYRLLKEVIETKNIYSSTCIEIISEELEDYFRTLNIFDINIYKQIVGAIL